MLQNTTFLFICKMELECKLRKLQFFTCVQAGHLQLYVLCIALSYGATVPGRSMSVVLPKIPQSTIYTTVCGSPIIQVYPFKYVKVGQDVGQFFTVQDHPTYCSIPNISDLHPFHNSTTSQLFRQLKISHTFTNCSAGNNNPLVPHFSDLPS